LIAILKILWKVYLDCDIENPLESIYLDCDTENVLEKKVCLDCAMPYRKFRCRTVFNACDSNKNAFW